jgi:FKBP12-rapamycin complex-associated protein
MACESVSRYCGGQRDPRDNHYLEGKPIIRHSEAKLTGQLDSQVHEDLFQTAFLMCYNQIEDDIAFKEKVHATLILILLDPATSKAISEVLLELLIFLEKEKKAMPSEILAAATSCAMSDLGDLHGNMPAASL